MCSLVGRYLGIGLRGLALVWQAIGLLFCSRPLLLVRGDLGSSATSLRGGAPPALVTTV